MKNSIVYICLILLLSSCSQRYAHVQKVKVNKAEKEIANKDKEEVREVTVLHQEEANQNDDVLPVIPETVKAEAKKAEEQKKASVPLVTKIFKKLEKAMEIPPVPVNKIVSKIQKHSPEIKGSEEAEISTYWLRVVIIGAILVLIGLFLPDPIRGILGIVGSVVIVIGLIMLLLELL